MKKLVLIFAFASQIANAQVGIQTASPDLSSVLDVVANNKGVLIPRISLTSSTVDLDGAAGQATGLLVFNTGGVFEKGFYYWDGATWKGILNSTAKNPAIGSLLCLEAELYPSSYTAGVPYNGTLTVPYTEGNGGMFSSGSPVTVNGLTFVLQGDKLNNGNGQLVFNVSGTPAVSSPAATTVTINNVLAPFFTGSCVATVGDIDSGEIKVSSTIGPLYLTTTPANGYYRYVTSPDGKFSVCVFVETGLYIAYADLKIRSNIGTPSIMWNAGVEYVTNGQMIYGNNGMTFPSAGVWYGNGGGVGTTMGTGVGEAWGDPDVYYFSPEYRRYTWTTTDSSDKTMYTLTFMLGAPDALVLANTTNCPGGTCTTTKAFLKIEQIKAK